MKIKYPTYVVEIFKATCKDLSFIVWLCNKRNGYTDNIESYVTEGAD